ncbi:MAG: SMP-30/gluconolactonase/LRE family protein [Verrucomicrobia bacterium]|nr:SMP-30/gluconolactonase/LRE family protein [Verrucomicrobiota bacterium]
MRPRRRKPTASTTCWPPSITSDRRHRSAIFFLGEDRTRQRQERAPTLLTKELTFPNGLAFSPDEKTLYVANSDPQRAVWMAFDMKSDGTLANGRVFFDATPLRKGRKGLPDGLKVDARGNVLATGPGGVLIFSPDGKHLGTLNTGEATANCAWGDDGSTLYITADMFLCRVKTATKGTGF